MKKKTGVIAWKTQMHCQHFSILLLRTSGIDIFEEMNYCYVAMVTGMKTPQVLSTTLDTMQLSN